MSKILRAAAAALLVGFSAGAAHATLSPFEAALAYPDDAVVESAAVTVADSAVKPVSASSDCCEAGCGACDSCCGDACGNDSCCGEACCSSACACPPTWTVGVGAVYLTRSRPDQAALVRPLAGLGVIASGADYSFGWAAGPDINLMRRLSSGNSLQVRYFGALNWDSNVAQYGAVGNVRIGSFSNFGATNLFGRYFSRLDSTEFNWLHPMGDRFTFLTGFRWIELKDDINHNITFPAFNADYNWHDTNHMYGGQVGGDLKLWKLSGPLTMNGTFKGGVYSNNANNDFTLLPSTGGQFDGGGGNNAVAFVGDIAFTMSYQVTQHFALRGGYQLLWIDGAALASDNMARATANSSQAGIDAKGQAFYHGALMSADFMW